MRKAICRCGSAILIDTSNSIRDRFKFEQEAAIEFINSVLHANQDKRHGGELRHARRNWSPT